MSNKGCSRRDFLKRTALSLAGAAAAPGLLQSCRTGQGGKPPNLLIVFPDQMRAQALGFMSEDPALTPTLDRFADEGVVLSQAVCNYPVCSPFRAMFMTGQWPHRNGVLANCNTNAAEHGYQLRTEARCWSDVLKQRGYDMGYIGKWHLDAPHRPYVECKNNSAEFAWNEWCPPERRHGFDFWYAYGTYDHHMRPMYWTTDAGRDDAVWVDQWGPEHEADQAIKFLENRDKDKPFALVVSMNPPHMPYDQLPRKYVERYRSLSLEDLCNRADIPPAGTRWGDYYRQHIRNYLAMVTGVDEQFGRILESLHRLNLEEDTLVLFTSDHGNCLGIHEQISKNNHFEESMRVPFILRWPGRLRPRREDLLISSPDIYPTLLDLMGFSTDIPSEVQGVSHARLLRKGKGPRPSSQPYFYIPYGEPAQGRRGVRTHRHTLMLSREPGRPETVILHDNRDDPYQEINIAPRRPEIVRKLQEEELRPWLRRIGDPWSG